MKTDQPVYLSALGILSALGRGKDEVRENLFAGRRPGVVSRSDLLVDGAPVFVGQVEGPLPQGPAELSAYASRNLGLTIAAADEIRTEIDNAITRYGRSRIAVVMATCTAGIAEGELAVERAVADGALPSDFDVRVQEIGGTSRSACTLSEPGGTSALRFDGLQLGRTCLGNGPPAHSNRIGRCGPCRRRRQPMPLDRERVSSAVGAIEEHLQSL